MKSPQNKLQLFTGVSTSGNLTDALSNAVSQAKQILQQDFFNWELVSIEGQYGGFNNATKLIATIQQKTAAQALKKTAQLGLAQQEYSASHFTALNISSASSAQAIATAEAIATPSKRITLQGAAGQDVLVSISIQPANTSFITSADDKGVTRTVTPSDDYEIVGTVPARITYFLSFHTRPWQFNFDANVQDKSQVFSLSSADLGWPDISLPHPDSVTIVLDTTATNS